MLQNLTRILDIDPRQCGDFIPEALHRKLARRANLDSLRDFRAFDLAIVQSFTLGGKTYALTQTQSQEKMLGAELLVPVAFNCSVAYTSSSSGTLTIAAGHTFTTGCIFDLYWIDATTGLQDFARNCTAGACTSASTSITFTTAVGSAIPAAGIGVAASGQGATAALQIDVAFVVTGNAVTSIVAACDQAAAIVSLWTVAPAEELAMNIQANGCYNWIGIGTNPIAGQSIVTARMSHADATTPHNVRVAVQLNA